MPLQPQTQTRPWWLFRPRGQTNNSVHCVPDPQAFNTLPSSPAFIGVLQSSLQLRQRGRSEQARLEYLWPGNKRAGMSFSKFSQAVSVLSSLESSSNVSLLCGPFLFCMCLCIFAPFGAAVWSWLGKPLLHPELRIHVYNDSSIVRWLQMCMFCFSQTVACHKDVLSMAEASKSTPKFHTRRSSCVVFFFLLWLARSSEHHTVPDTFALSNQQHSI